MKRFIIIILLCFGAASAFARQPERGYRGFIDWSNYLDLNLGFIGGDPGSSRIFTGFTTSHGYQLNSWLYVGGGAGFQINLDWKKYHNNDGEPCFIVPVFAESRLDARWGRFTPYLSVRLGANLSDHGGIYFSPMVGYRFNWGRKTAVNFGLGITLFGRRMPTYSHIPSPDYPDSYIPVESGHYQGHFVKFTASLSLDFQLP